MRKIIKLVVSRLFAVLVLGFFAAALILYQAGKYDVSFIPRETESAETSDGVSRQGSASTFTESRIDSGANIVDSTNATGQDETTSNEPAAWVDEYRAFLENLKSYETLVSLGYAETGAMFDSSNHVLAILPHPFDYPKTLSYRKETEEYTERVATSLGYETRFKTREVSRPALKLYMGLRVIDNGDGTMVYMTSTAEELPAGHTRSQKFLPGTAAVTP